MRHWEDWICSNYSNTQMQWLTGTAATALNDDRSYGDRIEHLEREIEELRSLIESVSRENIACNMEELL